VTKSTNRLAAVTGVSRSRFLSQIDTAHILCYHSVIPDDLADQGWVAPHAVTLSAFDRQMAMVAQTECSRRLGDVAGTIAAKKPLNGPFVSITFDDGLADNVMLALPILQKYGLAATFFLSTGHIDRGDYFDGDRIRILADAHRNGRLRTRLHPICENLLSERGYHKTVSQQEYRPFLDELWSTVQHRTEPAAVEACRVLRWEEARVLRDAGMEIGAHTVNHVILAGESAETRRVEIEESIRRVRAEMRREAVPFAFPNGQPEDFDAADIDLLRDLKTNYAVSTLVGPNNSQSDPLTLRRHCIGLHHRPSDIWTLLGMPSD